MTLQPQKAQQKQGQTVSEEQKNKLTDQTQEAQTGAEERAKKNINAEKSAQKQHDAQPEVASKPQGLNETQASALPARKDVRERRVADEFTIIVTPEALAHMAGRSAEFFLEVKTEAYRRIYSAERRLCGLIIRFGNVPSLEEFDRWWVAFQVRDLWFKLEYKDAYIREYALVPGVEPDPTDDTQPPPQRRQQRRPPPRYIGPRKRRPRDDSEGSRAAAAAARKPQRKAQTKAKGKPKKGDVRRALEFALSRALFEAERICDHISDIASEQSRRFTPRLLRSIVHVKRFGTTCGSALHAMRDYAASLVRVQQFVSVFSNRSNEAVTSADGFTSETYGPSGRLEPSSAGHGIAALFRLYSWKWDEPPVPWADDLFGVDWSLKPFGELEPEQAFT